MKIPAFIVSLASAPVTLFLVLLVSAVYWVFGAASNPDFFQSLPELLLGVFRHGNGGHLIFNCVLLLAGGVMTERRTGSVQTALLAAVCAVTGVLSELAFNGPGFIGISGVAYGLVAYGVMAASPPERRSLNALLLAVVLAAEFALLRANLSVFTHMFSAIVGGGSAMLSSFFNKKGPQLKPMEAKHLPYVVELIAQTDEDDAEEAEQIFQNTGFPDMFVLVDRGEVLGVTGYQNDDAVSDLVWLSWTYLREDATGYGLGSQMLNDLLGMLAKEGVRKIFIETSDYQEDGKRVYASAHRLYEKFGAKLELKLPDYHAPGEAKLIYSIENPDAVAPEPLAANPGTGHSGTDENAGGDGQADAKQEPDTGIRITGIEKAPETESVAGLVWEETPTGVAGADYYTAKTGEGGYSMGVLPLPGDLSVANEEQLQAHGFRRFGQLQDYYAAGQPQDWWIFQPGGDAPGRHEPDINRDQQGADQPGDPSGKTQNT